MVQMTIGNVMIILGLMLAVGRVDLKSWVGATVVVFGLALVVLGIST